MKALKRILGSILIVGLAVASVLQFYSGQALAQEKKYKIAVVVHGGEADPFWKPVKRGVKDASDLYSDLEVTYTGTTVFSVEEFMNNLETAIASRPDALVCTLAIPEAMDDTLRKVIQAGLPVVAINAPDLREPVSERIPVLTYVGEDSYFIGVTAAQETLKRITPKRAVFCSHHKEAANIDARGRGWVDTMTEQGITAESVPVAAPVNAAQAAEDVAAYLKDYPETDVLFISNTAITEAVIERLVADGIDVGNSVKIAQMDISPAILEYVQDGLVMFAMDQQPYLQGYMGVVFTYLNVKYGLTPPPPPLSTGPAVITDADINPAKGY